MLTLPLCGPYALAACLGACRIAPSPGDRWASGLGELADVALHLPAAASQLSLPSPGDRWASGLGELADVALHLPAAASQLSLPHQTTLALVTVLDYG